MKPIMFCWFSFWDTMGYETSSWIWVLWRCETNHCDITTYVSWLWMRLEFVYFIHNGCLGCARNPSLSSLRQSNVALQNPYINGGFPIASFDFRRILFVCVNIDLNMHIYITIYITIYIYISLYIYIYITIYIYHYIYITIYIYTSLYISITIYISLYI